MKQKTILWVILGFILVLLPLVIGVFHSGFFVSDDGHWMIIRLSAFYEALSSGQFPVRFLPRLNQGFGYPVADFLYPLFLYLGSVLHILKIPFTFSIKTIIFLSFFFSGFGMYLFLKKFFSTASSFIGGVLYVYLPYHLYDLYARGSVGEIVSLAIVPFLFWSIQKKSWIFSSIFLGLLIVAHNTLALFFLPVALLYALLQKMNIKHIVFFTSIGLGLAAFFWLPALYDKQFTVFDSVAVSNPFAYFVNTVSLGLVGWIAIAIFGGIFFIKKFYKEKELLFFFILGIVSLFFSFSLSSIFWHNKILSQFVQFPFRFLSITLFAESFLGAYLFEKLKKNLILSCLFVALFIFSFVLYLFPKQYDYQNESFYATNTATTTVQNEYMPKWVKKLPTAYAYQKVFTSDEFGSFTNISQKGTKLTFAANMQREDTVRIAFAYYPGWQVRIDEKKTVVSASSPEGLVEFTIPKGTHTIKVWYTETPLQLFADIISVVSLGIIAGFLIKKKYEK